MKVVLGFLFSLSAYFGSATYEVPFVGIAQPPSFLLPPFPRLSVPPHGSPPLGIAGACRPQSRPRHSSVRLGNRFLRP